MGAPMEGLLRVEPDPVLGQIPPGVQDGMRQPAFALLGLRVDPEAALGRHLLPGQPVLVLVPVSWRSPPSRVIVDVRVVCFPFFALFSLI